MAVPTAIPTEEVAAERARVLDRVKALWEPRAVLERLELRLRVWVVGRGVGPIVRLGHAEIGQEKRDRLAGHRAAAVGVHRQRPGRDLLLLTGLSDQLLGELVALARLDGPADGVAAKDVEDHVGSSRSTSPGPAAWLCPMTRLRSRARRA